MNTKRWHGLAAVLAAIAITDVAGGATVVHSGTWFDWIVSDPVEVGTGAEDLIGITLSIFNHTGDPQNNPQAVDAKASHLLGIQGQLHQQHSTALAQETTTDELSNPSFATAIDTHFLVSGLANSLAFDTGTGAPEEDYGFAASSEPTDLGAPIDQFADVDFGTFLTMTATQTGSVPDTWDLAYLVAPKNTLIDVEFSASNALGPHFPDDSSDVI